MTTNTNMFAEQQIIEQKRQTRFTCRDRGCAKLTTLSNVIIFLEYHYTPPRACAEGDHWSLGERQIVCPRCSLRHRILTEDNDGYDIYHLRDDKFNDIFDNVIKVYKPHANYKSHYVFQQHTTRGVLGINEMSAADISAIFNLDVNKATSAKRSVNIGWNALGRLVLNGKFNRFTVAPQPRKLAPLRTRLPV